MEQPSPMLKSLVSLVASLLAFAVFVSPIGEMRKIVNERSVGHRSIVPFLAMLCNCALWSAYGWLIDEAPVIMVNGAGLVCAFFYSVIFFVCATSQQRRATRAPVAAAAILLATVLSGAWYRATTPGAGELSALPTSDNPVADFVGSVGSIVCVLMFASPLDQVRVVLRRQSTDGVLSLPFAVTGTLCTVMWVLYGYLISDWFLMGPNLLGLVGNLAQLALFWRFWPSHPPKKQHIHVDLI